MSYDLESPDQEPIKEDLTTCAHCGCKVYEGAYKEEINGKELAFCCKHCARSYKKSH